MRNAVYLWNPIFAAGPEPWTPETPSTDLLQYWNDVTDPTIANPAVLNYRPIFQYNGASAGNIRPYQPGRCYLGDGTAAVSITGTVTSNDGTANLVGQSGSVVIPSGETAWNVQTDSGEIYKCDEGSDIIAFDSSGNGNDGTISNLYTGFHAEQNEYSFQNEVGFSENTVMDKTAGGAAWNNARAYIEVPGDFELSMTYGFTNYDFYFALVSSVTSTETQGYGFLAQSAFYAFELGSIKKTDSGDAADDVLTLKRVGSTLEYYINGVLWYTSLASLPPETYGYVYCNVYDLGEVHTLHFRAQNFDPNNLTLTSQYIPRNEAIPAEDVQGGPLQYSGRAPGYGALANLPCGTFSTSTEYVEITNDITPTDMTILLRFRFTGDIADNAGLLSNYASGGGVGNWYVRKSGGVNSLNFTAFSTAATENVTTLNRMIDGGENCLRAYWQDGVLCGIQLNDGAKAQSATVDSFPNNATPIGIGLTIVDTGSQKWSGEIWDVRMYSRILTNQEWNDWRQGKEVDPTGLLFHLPFSENGGFIIHDISGNNRYGTWKNYTLPNIWTEKQQSYAYSQKNGFNNRLLNSTTVPQGVNISVPNSSTMWGAGDYTIEYWVEVFGANGYTQRTVFQNGANQYLHTTGELLIYNADGFAARQGVGQVMWNRGPVHVVTTREGVQCRLFIDGVERPPLAAQAGTAIPSDNNLVIGTSSNSNALNGYIWGFRIYDGTALTSQEALDRYNGVPITPQPTFEWPINEGEGAVAYETVAGRDGTIYADPIWVNQPVQSNPDNVPGKWFLKTIGDQIDMIDSVTNLPWGQGIWVSDYSFGDLPPYAGDSMFTRIQGNKQDRFLHYRDLLSGNDLTKAQEYTQ